MRFKPLLLFKIMTLKREQHGALMSNPITQQFDHSKKLDKSCIL